MESQTSMITRQTFGLIWPKSGRVFPPQLLAQKQDVPGHRRVDGVEVGYVSLSLFLLANKTSNPADVLWIGLKGNWTGDAPCFLNPRPLGSASQLVANHYNSL